MTVALWPVILGVQIIDRPVHYVNDGVEAQ